MSVKCFDQSDGTRRGRKLRQLVRGKIKLFSSLFCAAISDKNQQWIRNQIYFLFIVPVVISSSHTYSCSRPVQRYSGWKGRERKTCCLLLLSEILFVSWCQTFSYILSAHYIIQQKFWANVKFATASDSVVGRAIKMLGWWKAQAYVFTSLKLFSRYFWAFCRACDFSFHIVSHLVWFFLAVESDKKSVKQDFCHHKGNFLFVHILGKRSCRTTS